MSKASFFYSTTARKINNTSAFPWIPLNNREYIQGTYYILFSNNFYLIFLVSLGSVVTYQKQKPTSVYHTKNTTLEIFSMPCIVFQTKGMMSQQEKNRQQRRIIFALISRWYRIDKTKLNRIWFDSSYFSCVWACYQKIYLQT